MSSLAQEISAAVVNVLSNITWSPTPVGNMTVIGRKVPVVASDSECPIVLVSQVLGEEVEDLMIGKVAVRYPVDVVFATKGLQALTDTDPIRSWRQQARRALNKITLGNIPQINDSFVSTDTPFDGGALLSGYNWSVLTITFETIEDRQS